MPLHLQYTPKKSFLIDMFLVLLIVHNVSIYNVLSDCARLIHIVLTSQDYFVFLHHFLEFTLTRILSILRH
jgi:hypothetical protein